LAMYNPGPVVIREWDGKLDNLDFYCRALSPSEITGLYLPTRALKKNNKSLTVSPNPAQAYLNITLENNGTPQRIVIRNITGQLVQAYTSTNNQMQLDVKTLSSGVYTVEVQDENGAIDIVKFIKE